METPAGALPVSKVAMTLGGLDLRSTTDMRVSGTCLVGSAGSIFWFAVTRARLSSGVMATLKGGPTTLTGTSSSAITLGGDTLRSMMVIVSAGGLLTTCTAPFTSITLLSLAEMAICASASEAIARGVTRAVSMGPAQGILSLRPGGVAP